MNTDLNFKGADWLELYQNVLKAKYIDTPTEKGSYCVEQKDDVLYIYFEGSSGTTDWVNNFDFAKAPYKHMECKWYVHRGFLRTWKDIQPYLDPWLERGDVRKVVIGGYSHGAALAVLCYEYVRFHHEDKQVIGGAFGCPRVLWGWIPRKIKKRFDTMHIFRCHNDLITHLPPALFFYRHVGNLHKIGKKFKMSCIKSHMDTSYIAALREMD